MADSFTINYSLTLPEPGYSDGSWGGKINTNFQTLDDLISRSLKATDVVGTIPNAAIRAGKALGFAADGTATVLTIGSDTDPSLRTDLAASSGGALVNMTNLTQNVKVSIGTSNPLAYVLYLNSDALNKQVDGLFVNHSVAGATGAGYCVHGIMTANSLVPVGNAGGGGFAANGAGSASGVVGNRYEDGQGHGGIFTRTGTGSGSGALGTFQSTGTGAGVTALKQNTNGAPGGPYGTGPALLAQNSSEQGSGIESYTESNNGSAVSNLFERRKATGGIVVRVNMLLGGTRTSDMTGNEVLLVPATASTGASAINAYTATIGANFTGSASVAGFNISNAATGGVNSYGTVAAVSGANTNNYGGRFSASGGTNNYGIYVSNGDAFFNDKVKMPNLPTYADNAAATAASLPVGQVYKTATGVLMVRY